MREQAFGVLVEGGSELKVGTGQLPIEPGARQEELGLRRLELQDGRQGRAQLAEIPRFRVR